MGWASRAMASASRETFPSSSRDATGADDLHRHLPSEVPVLGLVDDPEATPTQLADDLEAPDDRAGRERERFRLALLRSCRDLLEERGQRAGLDARRSTAGIPGAFGHVHPRSGGSRLPDRGSGCYPGARTSGGAGR